MRYARVVVVQFDGFLPLRTLSITKEGPLDKALWILPVLKRLIWTPFTNVYTAMAHSICWWENPGKDAKMRGNRP
jgi:hypothetical protein